MSIKLRVRDKDANDTSERTIGVGSAKQLNGRVFVLSLFIGSSIPWRKDEIHRLNDSVIEAEQWLMQQALRYGKNVQFHNYSHGTDGNLFMSNIPTSSSSSRARTYWNEMLKRVGWKDGKEVMHWARQNAGCNQSMVLVFANTQGRSYACQAAASSNRRPTIDSLEACCLLRPAENTLATPATIAHEMLHLFGAWDLYKYYLDVDNNHDDTNRAMRAEQMFPNSIMLRTNLPLSQLVIDEVNAWLVGLKEEGKDWYRWFEPLKDDYLIT